MTEKFVVKATEAKALPDGAYTGVITEVSRDTSKFDYTRLHIKTVGHEDIPLRADFPTKVSNKSALGRAIALFEGEDLEVGKEYDIPAVFTGRKVKFSTVTDENGFARVVEKSLKPAN